MNAETHPRCRAAGSTGTTRRQFNSETGICHLLVEKPGRLGEFLQTARGEHSFLADGGLSVAEWLHHGAIYVDGRRARHDQDVSPDQTVRIHTRPKRYLFSRAPSGDWRGRLNFENEDFLVFDKPPGLPTHPTLDNYVENAKFLLEGELKIPLFTTHRLDIPTRGLLILAKSHAAQAAINKEFARGRVGKIYHALTERPVPAGEYVHYVDPDSRVPRTIRRTFQAGWWECRLRVEESGLLPPANGGGAGGKSTGAYWHGVRLLTGKTHQVRAQFSALGSPLLGDQIYGGARPHPSVLDGEGLGSDPISIGLECFSLSLLYRGRPYLFERRRSLAGVK